MHAPALPTATVPPTAPPCGADLIIFDVDVLKAWAGFASLFLGLSFIFGNSIRTTYENVRRGDIQARACRAWAGRGRGTARRPACPPGSPPPTHLMPLAPLPGHVPVCVAPVRRGGRAAAGQVSFGAGLGCGPGAGRLGQRGPPGSAARHTPAPPVAPRSAQARVEEIHLSMTVLQDTCNARIYYPNDK